MLYRGDLGEGSHGRARGGGSNLRREGLVGRLGPGKGWLGLALSILFFFMCYKGGRGHRRGLLAKK